MNNVIIRNLSSEEWQDLKKIRLEGIKSENKSFARTPFEEEQRSEEEWKKRADLRLSTDKKEWLVAFSDNQAVGSIMISIAEPIKLKHVAHIAGVFVSAPHRNKGIASQLLEKGLEKLKAQGALKVRLEVVSAQEPAVNLYKKHGFEVVGTFQKEILTDGVYYDEFVMEKFFDK